MTPTEQRDALIASNHNNKRPTAHLDPTSPQHQSLDLAAHGFRKTLKALDDSEQAGIIYKDANGQYRYSIPTTQSEHDSFALQAAVNKDQQIAGIFHTHPGTDDLGQVFSPDDLAVANQLKVPSYVLFLKDGSLRKYIPGQTPTQQMAKMGGSRVNTLATSRGEPVQPPPTSPFPLDPASALQQGLAGTLPPQPTNPLQGLQMSLN